MREKLFTPGYEEINKMIPLEKKYLRIQEVAEATQCTNNFAIYYKNSKQKINHKFYRIVDGDCYECAEKKCFSSEPGWMKMKSTGRIKCKKCGHIEVCQECRGTGKTKYKVFNHEHDWEIISYWENGGDGTCHTDKCKICGLKIAVI